MHAEMRKEKLYADLMHALDGPGCPLCDLSIKVVRRYLDSVLSEYVNDPATRKDLRESRGYCNEHAWWLRRGHGHSLGVAILHQDLIEQALEIVARKGSVRTPQDARVLLDDLRPAAECPACQRRTEWEQGAIESFLTYLADDEFRLAFAASAGLCIPHFELALRLGQGAETLGVLVSAERDALSRLDDALGEFIRKTDYRFQEEAVGEEGDAWIRAIGMISGAHGVR